MSGGIVFTMFVADSSQEVQIANSWIGMRRLWMGWTSWIQSESICRSKLIDCLDRNTWYLLYTPLLTFVLTFVKRSLSCFR
jgi:hypothetical protein